MNSKRIALVALIVTSSALGCATEPGETTAIGAAAGGVLGAGLGAIIGTQAGSSGTGVALGAVAGSAAGSLVANQIEAQERALADKDRDLEKKDAQLARQRAEIEAARMHTDDSPRAKISPMRNNTSSANVYSWPPPVKEGGVRVTDDAAPTHNSPLFSSRPSSTSMTSSSLASSSTATGTTHQPPAVRAPEPVVLQEKRVQADDSGIREESLMLPPAAADTTTQPSAPTGKLSSVFTSTHSQKLEPIPSSDEEQKPLAAVEPLEPSDATETKTSESASLHQDSSSEDCNQAAVEARKVQDGAEGATKLFHLRRALRLCPTNAAFHEQLGDLYQTLNRAHDAQFEYKEALRLDPSNAAIKQKIETKKQGARY